MPVELLISPPASGKTHICIQRIQALRKTDPLAPVWVIVPDRLQAAAFRRRLAQAGGCICAQVGRFPDLYRHILEHEGSFQPAASLPLLQRLIQQTVDQAVEDGAIPYYQPLQLFPGFIAVLRDAFAEVKRALVTPAQFRDYAGRGTPAQQDLAELYARYQQRLIELGWRDAEEVTWQALAALERKPDSVSVIRLLVVDGFDSFDGSQYRVLKLLAGQAGELLVTFPGVRGSTRPAHRRFFTSIERLVSNLNPVITTLDNSPYLPAPIDRLERHLFEVNLPPVTTVERPLLIEARSPAEEAREALRWVKSLVVREEIPLGTCAIYTPNPVIYNPLLRAGADEFGIPIRFTIDESLENSPAVTAVMNLLSLPAEKFNSRHLINILRSPYFEFSIDTETVDTLEMISRVAQIIEGTDQWQAAWERLEASSPQQKQDLDDERNAPSLPRGSEAAALRQVLNNIFHTLTPPVGEHKIFEWITWLEDLLERLKFYERADSERDQAACEIFRETLRALVLSETVVGQIPVDYLSFMGNLKGTLPGEGYREPGIAGNPALLVGRMTEARGMRVKAVALLGLSEGSFPANERPDPFLDEELRADLGLDPRLGRDQAGLFYQAVTRADQHLLITRPYLSDDGEVWEASAFWKAAAALFDETAVSKVTPDNSQPLEEAASTQELLFSALRRKSLPGKYAFLMDRWLDLQHAQKVLKARRSRKVTGPYEGLVEGVTGALKERYAPSKAWSASRLETYGNCPFQFFVNNALELEPRMVPRLGLDARQRGSILHEILEVTYKNAADPANLDAVLESLYRESGKIFAVADRRYGFRPSALWKNEQVQLLERLEKTIRALAEDSEWTPIAYERRFGRDDEPVLNVELEEETMQLHGIIDRVDCNHADQLRVIDYKTGGVFSNADLQEGHHLQLPIYALAARDALHLGTPVEGIYWIINAAKASSMKLSTFSVDEATGINVAYEVLRAHLQRIVKGIRAAEFPPETPENGCPGFCPAAQWCWRFEPGR